MNNYQPTIGLEIHAELKTRTKMFCDSANDPNEKLPNVNVCPICLGHPGTLPTINKQAIINVLRVGLALGGQLTERLEFDRKNYFYPDLPKGYQISQYKNPLVAGGTLNGVAITRVHLEEDTARSIHNDDGGGSLIDFNRAGVPLLELVTEPVISSAKQAGDFAREFQLLLRYLGASAANMEKGEMRVEANVSVRLKTENEKENEKFGVKVEVKNLNSFRAVERAIDYEVKRQIKMLEAGKPVIQETRGWDENKGKTFSQRQKESAHDYRYFPEPDLPPVQIGAVPEFNNLAGTIPELPWQKRKRLTQLGFLQKQDVEQIVNDFALAELFDQVAVALEKSELVKTAANFILNDIAGQRRKKPDWPLPTSAHLAEVIRRYQAGEIASPQAKSSLLSGVITKVAKTESLSDLVSKIIADNLKVVADFRAGKQAALQYLIGQGMKESKGTANPKILEDLFKKKC
ncbi:MAG: Asp-tRNA(Asn)/Glu-tRNA(Gln) amidotransferase subunit GatB [Patescibacteria group bacterium]